MFPELSPDDVKARFVWARRQGHARWFWPDVSSKAWHRTSQALVDVTRKVLAGEKDVALDIADPEALSVAAYTSGMGPLLGCWVERGVVRAPPAAQDVLALHLSHNRARMFRLSEIAKEVVAKLAVAGIRPLIIKGLCTAPRYFPELGARTVSDIDMVIAMRDMNIADEVFAGFGYHKKPQRRSPYTCDWAPPMRAEPRTLMYVHRDDPWSFDVQASLNRLLPTGAQIDLDALYDPEHLDAWDLSDEAAVLRQPLLTLHLAAHISEALLTASLSRVTELVLVIRADMASGKFHWDEFLDGLGALGGGRFVYPALVLCEQLAPGTVPTRVLSVCASDAPKNLRAVMANISLHSAQPLHRHSVHEHFLWASNWTERVRQMAGALGADGRGHPLRRTLYDVGTKLWVLSRGRYTA